MNRKPDRRRALSRLSRPAVYSFAVYTRRFISFVSARYRVARSIYTHTDTHTCTHTHTYTGGGWTDFVSPTLIYISNKHFFSVQILFSLFRFVDPKVVKTCSKQRSVKLRRCIIIYNERTYSHVTQMGTYRR